MLQRWRDRWGWLDAILSVTDRFGAVGGGPLSASIALSTFLSLFPLLLVGIAVLGFLSAGDQDFATRLVEDLGLEGRTADVVTDAIGTAEGSRRAASVIGLVGLLWSGLGVVGSLQAAIDAVWQEKGRGLTDRLVALRWLAGAGVLFLASTALGPVGQALPVWALPLTIALGMAMTAALFIWTFATLGNVHVGWRAHVPGALLVAVGFEVLKEVGAIYVPRAVASSSALYGSLGVVFAVLAWLLLYGRLVVYGAVVNVLRWESARGTDVITIEVPHHLGAAPLTATRGRGGGPRARLKLTGTSQPPLGRPSDRIGRINDMAHDDLHHDPDHEGDHRHDLGLAFDLATMGIDPSVTTTTPSGLVVPAPTSVGRRGALRLLAGAAGGLALAACGKGGSSSSATTTSTTSTTAAASATSATSTTAAASATPATVTDEIPNETGGPFPGDGSNGPNVLVESGVVRQDIRPSFGSYSGTAAGVPLQIALKVVHAGTGAAYRGAAVYLWHCDQVGRYSLYSNGATDQNHLRGVQAADGDGLLAFTSVFPGVYSGRYPHIHFEVFSSLSGATSASGKVKTSQLALPAAACDTVYATSGYSQSEVNFPQTPIARDGIFSDGYSLQMATVTGTASGMTATLTVAV